ncbi:uncharacterized protein EI90DRAFT_1788556 [Cantharellus anzutake]|uniref:uncharacterized protein n=1 Tax=Cantharellus anzutake TaxID=1750568 RepID=UPI001907F392|nr:uncharacterized protein EI90DRAFT_1788556 [Cantharellus anzutake]KAF8327381.1 hypothetical protein EI90DRAFT_1788556 [Cantharellus anzutake]
MVRIMTGPLENIFGGFFVGNAVATFLFGILTVQVALYYNRFPQDGRWTRRAVGFLWAVILFQTVCMTKMIWWLHIQNYFNPRALATAQWEGTSYHLSTTVGSLVVQSFFVFRIWSLSANICVAAPLQALVIMQFAFATALSTLANISLSLEEISHRWNWLSKLWLTTQATCDALIAILTTFLLWYRKTGFKKTDRAINTMVYWSIATGSATCLQTIILISHDFSMPTMVLHLALSYSE